MLIKRLAIFFILFSLYSCAQDPDGYLKRSANNRLIDFRGFHGSKRSPIQNKRYIEEAKKNVREHYSDNYDALDSSEEDENHVKNIKMYIDILKSDTHNEERKNVKRHKEEFIGSVQDNKKFGLEQAERKAEAYKKQQQSLDKEITEIQAIVTLEAAELEKQVFMKKLKSQKPNKMDLPKKQEDKKKLIKSKAPQIENKQAAKHSTVMGSKEPTKASSKAKPNDIQKQEQKSVKQELKPKPDQVKQETEKDIASPKVLDEIEKAIKTKPPAKLQEPIKKESQVKKQDIASPKALEKTERVEETKPPAKAQEQIKKENDDNLLLDEKKNEVAPIPENHDLVSPKRINRYKSRLPPTLLQ